MRDIATQPKWCAGPIPEAVAQDYSQFSQQAFWSAYHYQSAIGLYRSSVGERGGDVLEVGCGPGWLTLVMRRMVPHARYVALDRSAEMLDIARGNAAAEGALEVDFRLSPAERLPFPDGSFDLVTSQSVFRQLDDPVAAIREAARVLRPGGLAYISDLVLSADRSAEIGLIADAPGERGPEFLQAAFASALTHAEIIELLSAGAVTDYECLIGGFGGFAPSSREVLEWIKRGLPLRQLIRRSDASEWSRRMSQHWAHIYLRK
jgi:ubiquinone/menaquinone biosynthesis C-methylase UbiE